MPVDLTASEIAEIVSQVKPQLGEYIGRYDERKYPPDIYDEARSQFQVTYRGTPDLARALEWKWGHIGKSNYPSRQKQLIDRVALKWMQFARSSERNDPLQTFCFWSNGLGPTAYISAAFLSHLSHPSDIPIIDQHNYRGWGALIRLVRPEHPMKKRPSNWEDILRLEEFISSISSACNIDKQQFDRFLMMFGKAQPRDLYAEPTRSAIE